MKPPPVTLTILRLGAQGDGVAEHDGQPVFVPFALPGETVEAEVEGDRARLLSIVTPDPARLAARCSHYGECGGCSLQHLPADRYLALKRDLVVTALSFQGISATVDDVVQVPPATRRRAVFAAHRRDVDAKTFRQIDAEDYTVVRIYGAWQVNARLALKARVENLLNENYEEVNGYPALGWGAFAGAEWRF
jgi:tRNA/tmRNA/rRNA uracil-C5-methylase (TrmA/RlmC/RlmD family)